MKFFNIILNFLIFNTAFATTFIPEQPSLATEAYILINYDNGKVLVEKNSEQKLEPASLTKMMTMYVVDHEIKAGRLSLNEEVIVSKQAWQAIGSRMFLNPNSKVKVSDIIKGIIIQSGNDASIAISEHIAGTEAAFASLMNNYAATLGMNNSHFVNATGLPDPNHYTTAKDLAILAKAIIKEHPDSYSIYSQKSFVYNNIEQNNRNKLLWRNPLVDGIKTGQTDNAGYCLAVSGIKDNTRLIAVLLGAKTDNIRTSDANKLLTWGFRFFVSHKIYQKDTVLESTRIWGGNNKTVNIGLPNDVYLSLLKNDISKVTASLSIPKLIKAPLSKGEVLGSYVVKLKDEIIAEYPVISLDTIKKGNLLNRIFDKISMYYNILIKSASDKSGIKAA